MARKPLNQMLLKSNQTDDGDVPYVAIDGSGSSNQPGQSSSSPNYTRPVKATSVTNTTVTVDTSADTLAAANANRHSITFVNAGSVIAYLEADGSAATAANGIPLQPGQSLTDYGTTSLWSAITSSGSTDIRVMELSY